MLLPKKNVIAVVVCIYIEREKERATKYVTLATRINSTRCARVSWMEHQPAKEWQKDSCSLVVRVTILGAGFPRFSCWSNSNPNFQWSTHHCRWLKSTSFGTYGPLGVCCELLISSCKDQSTRSPAFKATPPMSRRRSFLAFSWGVR